MPVCYVRWNPNTKIGAIVDQTQFNRVMSYIEAGKKAGAKVITGGEREGDKVSVEKNRV